MDKVTVAITTTGRPHFLRTALQSVQNQIGREVIGEVVVSENKGDRRSEEVVREFPNLPIRFLFRNPTLPMLSHLFSTFREARTPYLAILNDDDWWSSNHLAEAVAALNANRTAAGYVSAAVFMKDEIDDHPLWIDRSAAIWLMAGMPQSWLSLWRLSPQAVLALGWLYTPFHWSTMVARVEPMREVFDLLGDDTFHTHTIDRLVFSHLAVRGTFCYNPVADTFVRWHSGNWVKGKEKAKVDAVIQSTIAVVAKLAAQQGWNLRDLWAEALAKMPREIEPEMLYRFRLAHTMKNLRHYGLSRYFHVTEPRPRLKALRKMLGGAKSLVLGD